MSLKISVFERQQAEAVIELFITVFSDAEGKEEGESIGRLVTNMIHTTPIDDLMGFVASEGDEVVGCIFFSRVLLASGKLTFILSPVAIATSHQQQGIGQQLIEVGIEHLKEKAVDILLTYGDPAYYSRFGFQQISEDLIKAPVPLSQPIGWLAQSLTGDVIEREEGAAQCVDALSDPKYW